MDNEKVDQFLRDIPNNQYQARAMIVGARLLADAMDRQSEVTRQALEFTKKMADATTAMMNEAKKSMEDHNEGDEWKHGDDNEDNL